MCNESIVFHRKQGNQERLDPVAVLSCMCQGVLSSEVHEDRHVRVGMCNILLQRVQSGVPMSRSVQQELNARLFGEGDQ